MCESVFVFNRIRPGKSTVFQFVRYGHIDEVTKRVKLANGVCAVVSDYF